MDAHVVWFRRRLIRHVVVRAALVTAAAGMAAFASLTLATGLGPEAVVPWSIVAAQVLVLTWISSGVATNPLSHRYLRRYLAHRPRWVSVAAETPRHGLFDELVALGYHRTSCITDRGDESAPVRVVYRSDDRHVLALVGPDRSVSMLSRLRDGRVAITDEMTVPPHTALVVNHVSGDLAVRERAHRALLTDMTAQGRGPRDADPALLIELDRIERTAYAEIGPVWSSFVNVDSMRAPHRLLFEADADDVLMLALRCGAPLGDDVADSGPAVVRSVA